MYITGVEKGWVSRPHSIADFELIKVIGRGSYAKVLMVELKQTKCIYAMKIIKKVLVSHEVSFNMIYKKYFLKFYFNYHFMVNGCIYKYIMLVELSSLQGRVIIFSHKLDHYFDLYTVLPYHTY